MPGHGHDARPRALVGLPWGERIVRWLVGFQHKPAFAAAQEAA
jgi:hypothetical protein